MIRFFNIKITISLLWYLLPVAYLAIYIDRSIPIAIFATMFLMLGWISGSIFSTNYVLIDKVKIKNKYILIICGLTISLIVGLQLIALTNMQSTALLSAYRDDIYDDANLLFGSSIVYTFYNSFLLPMLLIGLPLIAQLPKRKLTISIFFVLLLLLVVDGIIKVGRFPILFAIYFLLYFRSFSGLNFKNLIMIIGIMLISMQAILYLRQYSEIADLIEIVGSWEILFRSALSYNLVGFIIFDDIATHSTVSVNPFNFNSFSAYLFFVEVLLGRFGVQIWYTWKTLNLDLTSARNIPEFDMMANAFGTNMMPVYFDFGLLGPAFLGFYLGLLSNIKTKGAISSVIACMAFFVMIMGIYQPIIVSPVSLILSAPILLTLVRFYSK